MKVPDKSEFPGTGETGNGISPTMQTSGAVAARAEVGRLHGMPSDRQQGDARDSERARHVPSSVAAWDRRVQSGQAGRQMSNGLNKFGRRRALEMFADWTDRIAAGEVPPGAAAPARHRAEHRHHAMGLGRSEIVPARFGVDRSPQSAAQSVRPDLRRARAELRLRAGARSCEAHRQPDSAVGARSKHAADQSEDAGIRRHTGVMR